MLNNNKKLKNLPIAVVVDAYSSGQFYATEFKNKGICPVHVASGLGKMSPELAEHVNNAVDSLRNDYDILIHDWSDLDDLKRRLASLKPKYVVAGCETGVELADILAEAFGTPGNGTAQSAVRRDKLLMHQALAAHGLPHLSSLATSDIDEALAFAAGLGSWPVVTKPLRSSGTEGVRLSRSPEELSENFGALVGSVTMMGERNVQALVQEYALGREFAVNTISRDGRHVLSDIWEYHKITSPEGAPVYERAMLVRGLDAAHRGLIEYAFSVLDALGVRFGPAHVEIMLTEKGPVLIECAARPMGGPFPQDLLTQTLGHTQVQWAVDSYVDPKAFAAHLTESYRPTCSMCIKLLISTREGSLHSIPGIALATHLPSARRGDFLEALSTWRLPRTVDLFTSSANICLFHADEKVVEADWAILRELEVEAQNQLLELCPADASVEVDENWFEQVPDEHWLKPEADAPGDADVIWKALALSPGARVLDCPCGDGRVGVRLARRGAMVSGVDINPRFIARAKERYAASGITASLRVGDMRALSDREMFDAVVNWCNSFGYFGIEDDFEVLLRFADALRPGGHLLLEAPNRASIIANITNNRAASGNRLRALYWDEMTERLVALVPVPGPNGQGEIRAGLRVYSLAQYKLLIRLAGLRLEKIYGEGLSEFCAESKRMIMVAAKP